MKIITFNKADTESYFVTVEEDSIRNKLSEISLKKDNIDYDSLIKLILQIWHVEEYRRYDDWAGTIIIEVEK